MFRPLLCFALISIITASASANLAFRNTSDNTEAKAIQLEHLSTSDHPILNFMVMDTNQNKPIVSYSFDKASLRTAGVSKKELFDFVMEGMRAPYLDYKINYSLKSGSTVLTLESLVIDPT